MSQGDSRLGRGLGAMMGEASLIRAGEASARDGSGFTRAPVDRIDPEPWHEGAAVDDALLDRLAASIRDHGLLDPVLVRRQGERFALVAGHARWLAAKRAGLADLPAILTRAEGQDAFNLYLERKRLVATASAAERERLRTLLQKFLGLPEEEARRRIPEPHPAPAPAADNSPLSTTGPRNPFLLVAGTFFAILLAAFVVFFPRHPEPGAAAAGADDIETLEELLGAPEPPAEPAPAADRSWMRNFVLPGATLDPGADRLRIVFEQGLFDPAGLRPDAGRLLDRIAERIARSPQPLQVTVSGYGERPWIFASLAAERLARQVAADRIAARPGTEPPPYPATDAFRDRNQTVTVDLVPAG